MLTVLRARSVTLVAVISLCHNNVTAPACSRRLPDSYEEKCAMHQDKSRELPQLPVI